MSDAMDAVRKAVARTKELAAASLVRKEEAEAELARLRAGGGAAELPGRVEALAREVAEADEQHRAAMAELAELRKLAREADAVDARVAVKAALGDDDPVLRSDEDVALDNVRAHLRDLEARVRVGSELGSMEKPSERAPTEPEVPDPPPRPRKKTL